MSQMSSTSNPNPNATLLAEQLAQCKSDVWRFIQQSPGNQIRDAFNSMVKPDASWHVFHPINELKSAQEAVDHFYEPLLTAFPDMQRNTDLRFGHAAERSQFRLPVDFANSLQKKDLCFAACLEMQ